MTATIHPFVPSLLLDTPDAPATVGDESTFAESFERSRAAIAAIGDDELLALNLDVKSCIATVLRAHPQLATHRAAIVAELPRFDVDRFDRLADYALALGHLQCEYERAEAPAPHLPALYEKALAHREALFVAGRALVHAGVLSTNRFDTSGGNSGYRNVGYELAALASTLLEVWPRVEGRTALAKEQIERAYKLGNRLVRDSSVLEQQPQRLLDAAKERQRGFTLLVRAYSDARRAMAAVRWFQGDADVIAPSLYAGRVGAPAARKARSTADDASTLANAAAPNAPSTSGSSASSAPSPVPVPPPRRGDSLFAPPSDEPYLAPPTKA